MAVGVHDYFKHYKRRTALTVMIVQIISALIASGLAWVLWQETSINISTVFAVSLLALVFVNLLTVPIILRVASRPFGVLTKAIAHVSKDPVVTPPPAITRADERSGLKALVQTIYEIAVVSHNQPAPSTQPQTASLPSDFFKEMADLSPCGIIVLDPKGNISYANPAAPSSARPNGGNDADLIFDQNNNLQSWLAEVRQNKVRDTHLWLRVGNKLPGESDRRIFDVLGYYQKNDASTIETVLITFDRTAVYANDQEDMDFIALAAHELRGPITVIRGYLDVFNQELGQQLTPDQKVLLDRLQVSAERLAGYVNNILNVSRYDRHQFSLHPQEESLLTLMKSVGPDLMLRAKTQNRSLVFNVPLNLPTIAVDSTSLGEVVTNLVDNAIKYSHEGGQVTVSAAAKDNFVEVQVQDAGIGMPASIVGNLFNRFYRSHRSKQQVSGTGLGLYICKTIVEAHGGTIWVRSVEGQGTVFGFSIPTYASVADKLQSGNNSSQGIVQRAEGWIKNHAMYRG